MFYLTWLPVRWGRWFHQVVPENPCLPYSLPCRSLEARTCWKSEYFLLGQLFIFPQKILLLLSITDYMRLGHISLPISGKPLLTVC